MTQENKQKLYRAFQCTYKWVDGKRYLNDEIPVGVPEVEVGMEYITDTTDDEFMDFLKDKIILMTSEVLDAYSLRYCGIAKKRYNEANKIS